MAIGTPMNPPAPQRKFQKTIANQAREDRGSSANDRLPAATTHPRASDPATRHAGASNRHGCSARGDASRAMNASRTYQRVRGRRVLHDHEQGHCRDNKIFHGSPPFAPLADVGYSTRGAPSAPMRKTTFGCRARRSLGKPKGQSAGMFRLCAGTLRSKLARAPLPIGIWVLQFAGQSASSASASRLPLASHVGGEQFCTDGRR
jgi:hypothetical protein